MYRPNETGLINGLLMKSALEPVLFLVDSRTSRCGRSSACWSGRRSASTWCCSRPAWRSIPEEIYEAAALDGASRVTLFFRVTLPLLWNTIQVAWVYLGHRRVRRVRAGQRDVGGPRRPGRRDHGAGLEIYRNAFDYSQFGYASAMGVALFFLTITFAALTLRVTRRESVEY